MAKKSLIFFVISSTIYISFALPTIVKKDLRVQDSEKFNYTELAFRIQERLNKETDPCDDFYEFACGGLLNKVEIPDDLDEIGMVGAIEEDTRYQLRDVLNQTMKDDDIAPFRLAKRFFKTCLDEESIEDLGAKPLIELIGKNKWPLSKLDKQDLPDLHELIKNGKDSGILSYALISVSVDTNLDNSSEFILYIDQHDSYLSQEIYLDGISDPVMVAYQNFIEQIMRKVDRNVENPEKLAKEIVEFEIELARIAERREDRRDLNSLDNHMTLGELNGNFSYIKWIEYINVILPKGKPGVTKEEHVIVGDVKYFEKLGDLLQTTPKYVIYNYIQWSIIAETLTLLSKDFRTAIANLDKVLYGTSAESLRWDECIALSMEMMPSIVGAMYIREYFTDESRKTVTEMLENIVQEFKELLKDVDWMDIKTKKTALEKIDKLNYFVGYADELANLTLLEHYYRDLCVSEDLSFFDMTLAISKFSLDEAFSFLYEKTVQRSDWRFIQSPATVNAFYLSSHNHIEILAAILQNEIFSLDRPAFLNYAALGHVIGHEITHALDDMGRQFDSTGNLKNWWHNETLEKYVQRAKCFVNQYSKYTVDSQHVDGINSLGENIADNGGFKVAYRTYKKIVKDDIEQELRDAGFKYTRDQLFWIAGAQTWCTKRRKESIHIMMETGDHPLEQFRVIGSLSNNKDFNKDFNCPIGSRMNPKTKCEIW
ncbi:neprilysin-2-like [Culicoides brevitarsis]|uniref:neprilysin-2-like n=1 Tax=Culicoides brevitarsis TaxID=469753 RepID=UPI00307BA634